jgi:hypothetical protein
MVTLFEGKPAQLTAFKIALVAFFALSIVNLILSIKVNKTILDKAKTA